MVNHYHDFTYGFLRLRLNIEISELRFLFFPFIVLKIIVVVDVVMAFYDVLLIEFVLFAVNSLGVLFQVPLSAKFLVAKLALNFLLHAAFVVHMT